MAMRAITLCCLLLATTAFADEAAINQRAAVNNERGFVAEKV